MPDAIMEGSWTNSLKSHSACSRHTDYLIPITGEERRTQGSRTVLRLQDRLPASRIYVLSVKGLFVFCDYY